MHPDIDVDDVYEVAEVVEEEPAGLEGVLQVPEDRTADHEDQVVDHRAVDHAEPLEEKEEEEEKEEAEEEEEEEKQEEEHGLYGFHGLHSVVYIRT